MLHRIEAVIPLPDFRLKVIFKGGEVRIFNARPYLTGPIFAPVTQPDYFVQVDVDEIAGSIFWPNGADCCPEFVYEWTGFDSVRTGHDTCRTEDL
jgi:hypothetical protein